MIIPYGESPLNNEPIVLVHGEFAELGSIDIKTEQYEFRCAYLYSEESFLPGQKAKLVLQPRLYINSVPAGLNVVSDALVTVTVRNDQDIPATSTFKDPKLSHREDLEIEVPLASQPKNISITFTGELTLLSGKKQQISSSYNVDFNMHARDQRFYGIFLKNTSEKGYMC